MLIVMLKQTEESEKKKESKYANKDAFEGKMTVASNDVETNSCIVHQLCPLGCFVPQCCVPHTVAMERGIGCMWQWPWRGEEE